MTILFAGSEMDAFSPSDGAVTETTNALYFDSAFSRASLKIGGSAGVAYAESGVWTGQSELYYHWACHPTSFFQTFDCFALCDGSTPVLKIVSVVPAGPGVGTLQMYYLNGGATWTAIGGTVPFSNALTHYDVYLKIDASGEVALFSSGTEMTSGTADLSHLSTVDRARHYANYSHNYISQCLASTESTIGKRLMTAVPSGAGATSAWTGDYTTVDEAVTNDGDFLNSTTAAQVETMVATPVGSMTGYTASAVVVSARAKRGGSGPQNIQMALRSSGTDYFTGTKALGVGYAPVQGIWEEDPATTSAWTSSAAQAAQPGAKSIA